MSYYIFHPFITAPLLLLALVFVQAKSKFNTALNIFTVGLYTFIIYKIIPWPNYGTYYLSYFYILLFLSALVRPITKFKTLPVFSRKFPRRWLFRLFGFIKALTLIFLLLVFSKLITSSTEEVQTFDLEFPLKNGTYYITNQHDDFQEQYAYDITKLDTWGREWNNNFLKPDDLEFYNIFKDTVYSPCNGRVSEVIENCLDHSIGKLDDFKVPSNKIVIQVDNKSIELLHLLNNSVFVNIGDTVTVGQAIALVGNSGMSKYPHLHINAYRNDVLLQYPPSIMISFNGKIPIINNLFQN